MCCFTASASTCTAFRYLRPVVAIDGTFTQALYKMILLHAVGSDGKGDTLPLVWGLIPQENPAHWDYLLHHFKIAFPTSLDRDFSFISDCQEGLIGAIQEVYPGTNHLHFCRHIRNNLAKVYGVKAALFFCRIT